MHRLLLGVCLCSSTVTAADLVERPLYAAFEVLPSTFRSTVTSRNGTFSGEDSVPNLGLAAGMRWSFASAGWSQGPVLGGEAAVENAQFDTGSHRAAEVRAVANWAVAVDHDWIIQAGMRAGYGLSRLELGVRQGNDVSATGRGHSFEPNAEVVWSFSERGRLLMGAGWRTATYDYRDDGLDITLLNRGMTFRLGLEWQFSVAPARLR